MTRGLQELTQRQQVIPWSVWIDGTELPSFEGPPAEADRCAAIAIVRERFASHLASESVHGKTNASPSLSERPILEPAAAIR